MKIPKIKKGATLENFVMIIGMIMILAAIFTVLSKSFMKETQIKETEFFDSILDVIVDNIIIAQSYASGANIKVDMKLAESYILRTDYDKVQIEFTKLGKSYEREIPISGINIIPVIIENAGEINIVSRDKNVYITDNFRCDINDEICDRACVAVGLCDPVCATESDFCNPYCDKEEECDITCYSNIDKGYYDKDCVTSEDGICDPASNLVRDGKCDSDCIKINGVCDLDCSNDFDCPIELNGICNKWENDTCFGDCNCEKTEFCDFLCEPLSQDRNWTGCVKKKNISDDCEQDCECKSNWCKNNKCQ